ncbi:MAG: hydroxyacid dehydrogenase [Lachnospiraceae bacterium]|nr:hydroxyacid dehydrogenase [Lachnospiraceae bacterium]
MKKVLYIQAIHPAGMDLLREKYDVVVAKSPDKETVLAEVKDASAIVSRLTVVDREIIDAGEKLEAVAKNGVGVDNIDVAYATQKGIPVLTTGQANLWSVAEHTVFAMGALVKRLVYFDAEMRKGNWKSREDGGAFDIAGRTFGIVGFGRIGRDVASIVKAFRMNVIAYDPFLPLEAIEAEGCACAESLEALCRKADVVSLHVPLTAENRGLINAQSLSWMKPTALLLNFSRGLLVDNDALYAALLEGRLAGAALDAHVPEPPAFDHPLYYSDKVLLSPHIAGNSEDALRCMSLKLAEGIDDVLSGRVPDSCANKKELYGG